MEWSRNGFFEKSGQRGDRKGERWTITQDDVLFSEERAVLAGRGEPVLEKVAGWRGNTRQMTSPLLGRYCPPLEPEDHTIAPAPSERICLPET